MSGRGLPGRPRADRAGQAAVARARALIADRGRFSEGEAILDQVRRGRGPAAVEARQTLARFWRLQGRLDEVRRLLRGGWEEAPDPVGALRELWRLDAEPEPIEAVQTFLDQAARDAPEEDRVWLGRANLAIRSGRLEDADRWLAACLERRPTDPAVWHARLRWALAADRPDEVRRALAQLPADAAEPDEALRIRGWLAARRGDARAEQQALESLLEQEPGDTRALDRLAELAFQQGRSEHAECLRRRKAKMDQTKERYRKLLEGRPSPSQAAELAELAEGLGRWFEAKGWWTLAARQEPGHPGARQALARLAPRLGGPHPGRTLAEWVADPGGASLSPEPSVASRPILGAPPEFRDEAQSAGLRFVYGSGRSRAHQLPETMGGGVGLLDYDGDGWLDVYCVQGGPFPPRSSNPPFGDRLYRNLGGGRFEDATASAGLAHLSGGYGHGVAVGDYDNDGYPDLFVTRWRSYALYHNRGDGHFEDATESAGLGGDRDWPTSAAFADLDDDGDLDLYVCHYLALDADHPLLCRRYPNTEIYLYCDPRKFPALPDHLFRNDGGRFVDVTAESGIVDRDGRGLGVVAADLDGQDGLDLFVANDTTANFFFRNLGHLHFEESGIAAGVAANAGGGFQAGMGAACGDLDGDGRPDLAVTNFYGESTTFYRSLGEGIFSDHTTAVGLAAPSRFLLGFGIALFDFNNDGQLDLATANGHVNDYHPYVPYAMPAQLLAGGVGGHLVEVTDRAGPAWKTPRVGRGLAAGDLDNDGRVDLVIVAQGSPVAYLQNRTAGGHFVTLRLEGTSSARDATGARVTIRCGGRRQVAQRVGGGSYLSAGDPRIHFGLGPHDRIESVEVRWPSGTEDRFRDLPADAGYLLREGRPGPEPLPGFSGRPARDPGAPGP